MDTFESNENKLAKSIGKAISDERKNKNLTQQELAELIGVQHTRISFIERGESLPKITTLLSICQTLSIDPTDFLHGCLNNITLDDFKPNPAKIKSQIKEKVLN